MSVVMRELREFVRTQLISEGLNKGDFTEVIIAYAIYLFVTNHGKIPASLLKKLRQKFVVNADDLVSSYRELTHEKIKHGNCSIGAEIIINSKTKSVTGGFGKDLVDDKDLDNILITVSNKLGETPEIQKLSELINALGATKHKSFVTFKVVSDGIAGESSGGNIKADVKVFVQVDERSAQIADIKSLAKSVKNIPISIKYKSRTAANLSPIEGPINLAKQMGFRSSDIDKISKSIVSLTRARAELTAARKTNADSAVTRSLKNKVTEATHDLAENFIAGFQNELTEEKNASDFADLLSRIFGVLEHAIVGSDGATLYNIEKNEIKTINREKIQYLLRVLNTSDQIGVGVEPGNNLVKFYVYNLKNPGVYDDYVFQFRFKIAESSSDPEKPSEIKFYIETAGNLLYMIPSEVNQALGLVDIE